MKAFALSLCLIFICAALALAGWNNHGGGWSYTTSTTAANVNFSSYGFSLSVYNDGSDPVYVQINQDLITFTNNIANSNVVVVPAKAGYTFEVPSTMRTEYEITSLCYQASANTPTIYVGLF